MSLEVGSVYYIYNKQIHPPKSKYSICVVVDDNLFFCINSKDREMYECIHINQENNRFLKHDSYISCSQAFHFEDCELKDVQLCGSLAYCDLKSLKEHIEKNVRRLPKEQRKRILKALSEKLEDYI